jgi:hypothetical protein
MINWEGCGRKFHWPILSNKQLGEGVTKITATN